MKKCFLLSGFTFLLFAVVAQTSLYEHYSSYKGNDLGLTYSPDKSVFRIWAPTASAVELRLYRSPEGDFPSGIFPMKKSKGGTWTVTLQTDHKGKYYTIRAQIDGKWSAEVTEPHAKAVGINGKRAAIIDLDETNPVGWKKEKAPAFANKTDAVIYELHIRDASIALNSGIKNKGKFLGLTENGTVNTAGLSTGLDHLKELGVTHIHLLPFFDYNSVNEKNAAEEYNWGYDPLNYNVPEGSYSTNPYDPATRISELKQLVKTLHENGLRVVMDVAYNHTALTESSAFNQLVPGYYYRHTADGKFSNATACGNETASERIMLKSYIIQSMLYWVKEYHVDGFRIDLMGVHDVETMNAISSALHKIKPDILLYGEGWTAGPSPLPEVYRAVKKNVFMLSRIAVFSDDIRDGIKGNVFNYDDKGFVSGKKGMEESIRFGVVASCSHPQVDYSKVNYSKAPYAVEPWQTITYAECHDNHVLWDKLAISAKGTTEKERKEMHKLALSIVLSSQGISFLHAGTEFLRSKKGVENSFESSDSINAIDWDLKTEHKDLFDYTKTLIRMRKEHPAFRMMTAKDIAANINFDNGISTRPGMVSYLINGEAVKDKWKKIFVVFRGQPGEDKASLPPGKWKTFIHNNRNKEEAAESEISIAPYSCTILYQE